MSFIKFLTQTDLCVSYGDLLMEMRHTGNKQRELHGQGYKEKYLPDQTNSLGIIQGL